MIVKLDSGKELTLEEVKEIIDKFKNLLTEKQKEYIPYSYPVERQIYPQPMETWYGPTCVGDCKCQ